MAASSVDVRVEERVAQLEAISQRRNELLRQMYYLLRRRKDVHAMLEATEDHDDGVDLEAFLDRFDLNKHPETGGIENLAEIDLPLEPLSPREDDRPGDDVQPAMDGDNPSLKAESDGDSDSPMSESPLSPEPKDGQEGPTDAQIEEDLQYPESPVEVSRAESEYRTASPASPEHDRSEATAHDAEHGQGSSPASEMLAEDVQGDEDDDERDELDLISNRSSTSPYPQASVAHSGTPHARSTSADEEPSNDEEEADGEELTAREQEVDEPDEESEEAREDEWEALGFNKHLQEEDDSDADSNADEKIVPEQSNPREAQERLSREDDGRISEVRGSPEHEQPAMSTSPDISMEVVEERASIDTEDQPATDKARSGELQAEQQTTLSPEHIEDSQQVPSLRRDASLENTVREARAAYVQLASQDTNMQGVVGNIDLDRKSAATSSARETRDSSGMFSPLSSDAQTPERADAHKRPSPYVIPTPSSPVHEYPAYDFTPLSQLQESPSGRSASAAGHGPRVNPCYTLPPLKALPSEFNRKGKTLKQRKRDKEREKSDKGSERGDGKRDGKDDWISLGANRWGATMRANPVWKRVSRAQKCLTTREWSVAYTELRFVRALDRVESLKDKGKWSFRQPKKQRAVGVTNKTHWDYLLHEMQLMRIDFREERKWKYVLAFELACAAVDWHLAGSTEERHKLGISVYWRRPAPQQETEPQGEVMEPEQEDEDTQQDASNPDGKNPMSMIDYPSSEASDDEQEQDNDQQENDVIDDLAGDTAFQDVLRDLEQDRLNADAADAVPKVEDIEDQHMMSSDPQENGMDASRAKLMEGDAAPIKVEEDASSLPNPALKTGASDPVLGSQVNIGMSTRQASKPNPYNPLRDSIIYSDATMLFLDLSDADGVGEFANSGSQQDPLDVPRPPPDLSEVFPELRPLEMLDPPSSTAPVVEGKKKGDKKEDPHKRVDDTNITKLTPVTQFMQVKPTLIGPAQPSKRWRKGRWLPSEEPLVLLDLDNTPPRVQPERMPQSGLFVGHKQANGEGPSREHPMMPQPPKDAKKRILEYPWTAPEDSLLKSLADKFPNNWLLIAECFNASRVTLSTDRRTPWDCYERWSTKWGSGTTLKEVTEMPPPPPPSTQGQMTTRGVKRSVSAMQSPSSPSPSSIAPTPTALNTESRKRRRHQLIHETMRKAAKRREVTMKTTAVTQRKTTAVHDTHGQYTNLPKHTPLELSRKKAEKEARANQELQLARRQEEITRQAQLRNQQAIQGAQGVPNMLQQAQMLQQQHNGAARIANGLAAPALPQIRNQVNISQQRLPSINVPNTRLSEQQMAQMQNNAAQQNSPPRNSATPTNPFNPPRPPSVQPPQNTIPTMQGVAPNTIPRPPMPNPNQYYQLQGATYGNDPLEHALRIQSMQQYAARFHALQAQAQAQQAQNAQSGGTQNNTPQANQQQPTYPQS